jgi:hypothetical protein
MLYGEVAAQLQLGAMDSQDSRPLRLGWGAFAAVAVMLAAIVGLVTFLPGEGARPVRLPMGFFCASILGFFAFRWHSLRRQVFSGRLLPSEFRKDPRRYILGPRRPLVIWFAVTVTVFIGTVVLQAPLRS